MPRGGKRIGAGAKPHTHSEATKKRIGEAIEKAAKEKGINSEDVLAEILVKGTFFDRLIGIKEWLAAYSMYLDAMVVKASHKTVEEHKYDHRVVILPEIKRPKDDEVAQA